MTALTRIGDLYHIGDNNGSAWVDVCTPGISVGSVNHSSIAIDAAGAPYVVYQEGSWSSKAIVKKFDGSGWATLGETTCSAGISTYASLTIDRGGTPM